MSPTSLKSLDTALRTSVWFPIRLNSRVGGTLIFSPSRVASFFIESFPEMQGRLYALHTSSRARLALTSCASLYRPSGVFVDSTGSGQQKLSRPAIKSKSTPTQTALRNASSILAAAIAYASMSEYRGTIPFEITAPWVWP